MNEVNFNEVIEDWIEYCRQPHVQLSSSFETIKDCDPYRNIVSMGCEALPFIRQVYERDSVYRPGLEVIQAHGLVLLVMDILDDKFSIPEEIQGQISEIEKYTKRWLDENISKYVAKQ